MHNKKKFVITVKRSTPFSCIKVLDLKEIEHNVNLSKFITNMMCFKDKEHDACILRVLLLHPLSNIKLLPYYDDLELDYKWINVMHGFKHNRAPIRCLVKNRRKYIEIYHHCEWHRYTLEEWYQILHQYLVICYEIFLCKIENNTDKINVMVDHYRTKVININTRYMQDLSNEFIKSLTEKVDINTLMV